MKETERIHVKLSEMVDSTGGIPQELRSQESIVLRFLITCSSGAMRTSNLLMCDSGK